MCCGGVYFGNKKKPGVRGFYQLKRIRVCRVALRSNPRQAKSQFFVSAPGVFLVGSGVLGPKAPVFFLGSGAGTTTIVGGAFGSFGITTGGRSGGDGTGFCASTGVAAKTKVANVKADNLSSLTTSIYFRGQSPPEMVVPLGIKES